MRHAHNDCSRRTLKGVVAGLVLMATLVGASGVGCDHNAQSAFRQAAVGPIGDGVKTIMDGALSGIIAALENAGSSSSSSNSGTGT